MKVARTTELVRVAHAAAMQALIEQRNQTKPPSPFPEVATAEERAAHSARMRCIATALTHLETAQMFAVRALHTAANAGA